MLRAFAIVVLSQAFSWNAASGYLQWDGGSVPPGPSSPFTVGTLTVGGGAVLSNMGIGAGCSISVGTTCTASTPGSTATSKCFFSQTTGVGVLCTCAAGAGTTQINCPAATTAAFNAFTLN